MNYNDIFNKMRSIYNDGHHKERGKALYNIVKEVHKSGIEGDFVECGVASGKSTCIAALTMKELGMIDRKLWLYDTYEGIEGQRGGFDRPSEHDVSFRGESAITAWETGNLDRFEYQVSDGWVRDKIKQTGYPEEKIVTIKGRVEDTIPETLPRKISILRLDTDFYYSTKHELEHLYPLLSDGGYLLLDDYGHWEGCKKAVHEYFGEIENIKMGDYTLMYFKK